MEVQAAKARSLWPKEHGAYGQLALPLVTALASGRPSWASAFLVCAVLAIFIAHEPLLVWVGARGAWAKQQHGARARRVLIGWAALGLLCGLVGLAWGSARVARATLAPLGAVVILAPIVVRGAEKTLLGEVVVAVTLAAAAFPVALASKVPFDHALATWGMWSAALACSTAAVHFVLSAHKRRSNYVAFVLAFLITSVAVLFMTRAPIWIAASPMLLFGWLLILMRPHARHLKRIGWTLVTCGVVTALIAVGVARTLPPGVTDG